MITVYGIPNCDTVKRARAWLAQQGIEVRFHDFKKAGVPADALGRWLSGPLSQRVLNRQGTSWRKLDIAQQGRAQSPDSLHQLLTEQPSLIKRPVVEWADGTLTIGFDEAQWRQCLGVGSNRQVDNG